MKKTPAAKWSAAKIMGLLSPLTRRQALNKCHSQPGERVELEKCLTTMDLVSLGVGSCCGAGMYLTAGIIAAQKAGPGGILSIIMAGLCSVLTGVHYAELAGICPHTSGSAYMYTYVTVGELAAFVIGWGLIVEYVIGTAAASVALSETFHSITEHVISNFINKCTSSIGLPSIDVIAAIVCLLLMCLLASGVKMSARFNNALNCINFFVWMVFVCASVFLGSSSNWTEHGGFLPYGHLGVLSAIPTAFYAFIGFDGLATTGAECKTPVKSIPVSVVLSIFINIIVFVLIVAGLTYNMPYSSLPADTAMLDVFAIKGYPALKYVMAVGAVAGLFAATFGSLFPLPRVLQAMAQDGLLFRYFACVCPKRHTALRATIVSGLVAAFLAAFINLSLLIELVLIGTLLGYVIVTYATLIIRYTDLETSPSHVTFHGHLSPLHTYKICDTAAAGTSLKRKASDTDLDNSVSPPSPLASLSRQSSTHSDSAAAHHDNGSNVNTCFFDDRQTQCMRRDSASSLSKRQEDTNDVQEHTYVFKLSSEKSPKYDSYIPPVTKNLSKNLQTFCSSSSSFVLFLQRNMYLYLLTLYICLFLACGILANLYHLLERKVWAVVVLQIVLTIMIASLAVILMFIPQLTRTSEGFKAPLVPLITVFTAGINIYLMTSLNWMTWLLFLVWMVFGLSIYFSYGTRNSGLSSSRQLQADEEINVCMDMELEITTTVDTEPLLQE